MIVRDWRICAVLVIALLGSSCDDVHFSLSGERPGIDEKTYIGCYKYGDTHVFEITSKTIIGRDFSSPITGWFSGKNFDYFTSNQEIFFDTENRRLIAGRQFDGHKHRISERVSGVSVSLPALNGGYMPFKKAGC